MVRFSAVLLTGAALAACSSTEPNTTSRDASPAEGQATVPEAGSAPADAAPADARSDAAVASGGDASTPRLAVDFDDGTFGPLVRSFGPQDNPALADPAYTVEVRSGQAHFVAPAAQPGPRLTGFLDLPASLVPIASDLDMEFTFPNAAELGRLGQGAAAQAIAGCYVRGGLAGSGGQWVGGRFGDYWFGYVWADGMATSAIRQGTTNLVSERFSATQRVTYRLRKRGLELTLLADYDRTGFHQVGGAVTLVVNPSGSPDVAITHVRVLDTSGAAVDVTADDFRWFF